MSQVCKEKSVYSPLFILFRLGADWLQLFLIVVSAQWFIIPSNKLWVLLAPVFLHF